jgi:hypothetical protein
MSVAAKVIRCMKIQVDSAARTRQPIPRSAPQRPGFCTSPRLQPRSKTGGSWIVGVNVIIDSVPQEDSPAPIVSYFLSRVSLLHADQPFGAILRTLGWTHPGLAGVALSEF